MKIHDQHTFNKAVSRALYDLYILTIPGAEDCGEDADFRAVRADIDAYAFRDDIAAMPSGVLPDPPAVTGD